MDILSASYRDEPKVADYFVLTIVDNFPWHENVYLSPDSQKSVTSGIVGTRREGL